MEHHAADHLDIKGPHFQRPACRFADHGERFRQQRVQCQIADRPLVVPRQIVPVRAAPLALGVDNACDPLLELGCLCLQRLVGERLCFRL